MGCNCARAGAAPSSITARIATSIAMEAAIDVKVLRAETRASGAGMCIVFPLGNSDVRILKESQRSRNVLLL
jgi:hypothetical protein